MEQRLAEPYPEFGSVYDWSVVTVSYNSLEHLKKYWTHSPEDRSFRWVAVDNGSSDGSVDFLERHADEVVLCPSNPGFATANNAGLERVRSKYVLFVNPDVQITGDWQRALVSTVVATGGIVSPQLVNPDGTSQPNARGVPFLAAKVGNRLAGVDASIVRDYARADFDEPTYCAWTMGAAVAAETALFREIGAWDGGYFMYYEDHELGLRAWRRGYSVAIEPTVRWVHDWQRETTRVSFAPWKRELAAMSRFYRQHPVLIWGTRLTKPSVRRLEGAGFGRMLAHLWQPTIKGSS